ncbi:MAG: hypothetical protein Pg6B_04730 [Candidatus Azobacteroides pseudotrichonymphae]|nr:MAG: hypothetical protein Pg6B_04730 [Candidatus Azobacteroides pseudotrichonymphae]
MSDRIIEELHKIREENYEKTKNMTFEEEKEYTEKYALKITKLIEKAREKRAVNHF